MAWGQRRGIDDILSRLNSNDASLTALYLMRTRQFGLTEAVELCTVLSETNHTLQELNLSSHQITPEMAEEFAKLLASTKTLKNLSLGNSTFGDDALAALCQGLATNTSLERLDLESKGLSAAGCAPLAQALLTNTTLKDLTLAFNNLGPAGLELLVPALSGLHHLDLSGCNLDTPAAVTHVAAALRACSSIKSLRFEDNVLGVEGAQALGPALQGCISLKLLSLKGTALEPEGAAALAPLLPTTLTHLDLSSTKAGAAGISALAKTIPAGSLSSLDILLLCDVGADAAALLELAHSLAATEITSRGALSLDLGGNALCEKGITALSRCPVLRMLRLHDCKLGDSGAAALGSLIADSEVESFANLVDLDLSGNGIGAESFLALFEALKPSTTTTGTTMPYPKLTTLIVAVNPGLESDEIDAALGVLGEVRPELSVVRRNADTGEQKQGSS